LTERNDDKLWGGRFDQAPDRTFYEFQRSFPFDRQLLPYELAVDRAWAGALAGPRILTAEEVTKTLAGLDHIAQRACDDASWLDQSPAEDVHHFVEQALVEKLGPLGWKLHTGRSRNELIATDLRLFVKDSATGMRHAVTALIKALVGQAEQNLGTPMPGMTHMQHAQPILLAHFLLAHAEAFARDLTRLAAAAESADACPMGSGALAGCSFAIDREAIARELGFSRITANSLDAVSDRDFALDYLFALAGIATHLSRLAEDFVIFASQEFAWVVLSDEFSTGCSLMPQKKNPDVWELLRGKTGRITTALSTVLITLKGLPSSYQRDLQEDKEPLFAAHEHALTMLHVATGAIRATRFNTERLRVAASDPALLATEVADYLVRRGVPFRKAHDIVGNILRQAEAQRIAWNELPLSELKKFSSAFDADFHGTLNVDSALACKAVPGGTAPQAVREHLADLRKRLSQTGMAA
jgi:argininosuccinate lyase